MREVFDEIAGCEKLSAVRALRDDLEEAAFDTADNLAFDVLEQIECQLAEDAIRNRGTDMAGPIRRPLRRRPRNQDVDLCAARQARHRPRRTAAQHAYRSRMKAEPPALVEGYFEREGQVLHNCSPDDLNVPTAE